MSLACVVAYTTPGGCSCTTQADCALAVHKFLIWYARQQLRDDAGNMLQPTNVPCTYLRLHEKSQQVCTSVQGRLVLDK